MQKALFLLIQHVSKVFIIAIRQEKNISSHITSSAQLHRTTTNLGKDVSQAAKMPGYASLPAENSGHPQDWSS